MFVWWRHPILRAHTHSLVRSPQHESFLAFHALHCPTVQSHPTHRFFSTEHQSLTTIVQYVSCYSELLSTISTAVASQRCYEHHHSVYTKQWKSVNSIMTSSTWCAFTTVQRSIAHASICVIIHSSHTVRFILPYGTTVSIPVRT